MSNFIFTKEQLEWIEALESGEYKQCREALWDSINKGFCCLGLACKLNGVAVDSDDFVSGCYDQTLNATLETKDVMNKLHLRNEDGESERSDQMSLVALNDLEDKTFSEIAAILRESPEAYFSQGAES